MWWYTCGYFKSAAVFAIFSQHCGSTRPNIRSLCSGPALESDRVQPSGGEVPLISVIMPCYNGEVTLREAVDSVIRQTFTDWELLLVDDGSTDGSPALLAAMTREDARIRVLRNPKPGGAAAARNRALSEARGRYVAFLDCDDAWMPQKLDTQLRAMTDADAALSSTAFEVMDHAGKTIGRFAPRPGRLTYRALLGYNRIGTITTMLDRSLCGDVRFHPGLPQSEDYQLWLSILKRGLTGICLKETLARYRIHGGTLSSNKWSVARTRWRVYREFEKQNVFVSAFYWLSYTVTGFMKVVSMRRQQLLQR
jgi:teichuronic acid biosynthesis glycosyltransferase TuaG